jgi:hypothetical protein
MAAAFGAAVKRNTNEDEFQVCPHTHPYAFDFGQVSIFLIYILKI